MKTLLLILFPALVFSQEYPQMKLIGGKKIVLITFNQMQQINELHQREHFFERSMAMMENDNIELQRENKALRTALNSLKQERQYFENVSKVDKEIINEYEREAKFHKRKLRLIKIRDYSIIAGLGLGGITALYFILK